jgi:cystathionine beta-synthase
MIQEGLLERVRSGTVCDLIARDLGSGEVVSVGPADSLQTAVRRMRAADVSQLPVLEGDKVVGLVDESDVLQALMGQGTRLRFDSPVSAVMSRQLRTVDADAPLDSLMPLFAENLVPIVLDEGRFLGLVTRVDLINHLRRLA